MRAEGWEPKIYAADAEAENRFTVSLGERAFDDPFTAIVSFDGNHSQPWSRVDVDREVVDVARALSETGWEAIAVSDEGDIYYVSNGSTHWYKLPGTGVLSEDADGRGAINAVATGSTSVAVVGASRQLYERETAENWKALSVDTSKKPGYGTEDFTHIAVLQSGDRVIASHQKTESLTDNLTSDPRFRPDLTPQEIVELLSLRRQEATCFEPLTTIYAEAGGELRPLGSYSSLFVRDVFASGDEYWIVGVNGLIMHGEAGQAPEMRMPASEIGTILSVAVFMDQLIVSTDYGLHRFDGRSFVPIKPMLPRGSVRTVPTPIKIQAIGNLLFVFDYHLGVCRWDGTTWDWTEFPKGLIDREFRGFQ